jgi:hypothetical protein
MPRVLTRTLVALAVAQALATVSIGGTIGFAPVSSSVAATGEAPGGDADADLGSSDPGGPPPASSTTTGSSGESPPSVTASVEGPLGKQGWYVGDVAISWEVSDEDGAVTSTDGCSASAVTEDTSSTTFACTATSDGGTTTTTVVIARDASAPADVTVAADRAPDGGGAYRAPFTATWSGTDATSGISVCTSAAYSGPDTGAGSLEGTCTDAAGNESAPVVFAFAYDATAPTVSGTPSRAPDHGDWYNAPVTITWSSDEAGSTCDAPTVYSGPDTDEAVVQGSCTDAAGNSAIGSYALSYDDTAPSISVRAPSDASYILRQPVAASYACSDATAGLDVCDGSVANGANIDTSSVGAKRFTVEATDRAGNVTRVERSYRVEYQPAGVRCGGVRGHEILEPVSADGSSVFKRNSTVPAKFRVCDWHGAPVTTSGVVESFRITGIDGTSTDAAVPSTNSHDRFRAGDSQWIYNVNTREMPSGSLFDLRIALDDGTSIPVRFRLR